MSSTSDSPRGSTRRPGPVRVLVVDDSEASLRALTGMLRREVDIQVVGEASDGEEALRLAFQQRPDCEIGRASCRERV